MRVVVIGDIGVLDDMVHIGDEAMFETFAREIGRRGFDVVGVSSSPAESARRYGIETVPRIGFDMALGREAARARMRRAVEGDLPSDDPAQAVLAAIGSADAVAVAGGGNMASTWPTHIYERATLAALAERRGLPFVVSGQTLGPALVDEDRDLVRGLCAGARLVGVREEASHRLAQTMGLPPGRLQRTVDDASFLVDAPPSREAYALVSLSTHVGEVPREAAVAGYAALLDRVAERTGLPILFHAHWASLDRDVRRGDSVLHEAVRAAMSAHSDTVPTRSSTHSALLARSASFVVTSRYHPAVFAAPAGVPIIGVPVDEYTRVKLTGALGNFGQDGIAPLAEIDAVGAPLIERLWSSRAEIGAGAEVRTRVERARTAAWWDGVADALRPAG